MPVSTAARLEDSIRHGVADADKLLQLGMMYSAGNSVPADMVAAHKWFNIAARHGNAAAARLRREIAIEMSDTEVAAAQRAARAWMTRH